MLQFIDLKSADEVKIFTVIDCHGHVPSLATCVIIQQKGCQLVTQMDGDVWLFSAIHQSRQLAYISADPALE